MDIFLEFTSKNVQKNLHGRCHFLEMPLPMRGTPPTFYCNSAIDIIFHEKKSKSTSKFSERCVRFYNQYFIFQEFFGRKKYCISSKYNPHRT